MNGALFYNPSSGARDPEVVAALVARAEREEFAVYAIEEGIDIGGLVADHLARGERLFVAAGGDGTIHSVIQPLVNTEGVLGVIPIGTFNHFARDFSIPLTWEEAFDLLLDGSIVQVDAGKVNDQYFLNNLSIGLYPEIAEGREQLREMGKWKAYRKAVYDAIQEFHHVSLVVETPHRLDTIKTHIFMVAVNPYDFTSFGLVAPRETTEGGQLTVYWLPYMDKLQLIKTLARYFRGKIVPGTDFHWMRTSSLRVQSSRGAVKVGVDGELHDMEPPLVITLVPKSVQVRVPRAAVETLQP